MTSTLVASLAAVAFFLLLMAGAQVGFGISALPPAGRRALAGVVGVAFPLMAYVAVRVMDGAASLRPLETFFETHRRLGLLVTLPAAALGFALFMGGILHLLLTSGESETFTLGELKRALRTGAWLRTRRWRRRVVIVAGVGLFAFGLFGFGIVLGSVGVKLLLTAGLLAVAARTIQAAASA